MNAGNAFDTDKALQRNIPERGDPWSKNKQKHNKCKKKPQGLDIGTWKKNRFQTEVEKDEGKA